MKDPKFTWKQLAREKSIDRRDVIQYCILRALRAKNDNKLAVAVGLLQAAFSPITNLTKLENGATPYQRIHIPTSNGRRHLLIDCLETDEERKQYRYLYDSALIELGRVYGEYHTFILVRQDISPEQQLVQAGHAIIKLGYSLGFKAAMHRFSEDQDSSNVRMDELNFVVCGVKNKEAVDGAAEYIHSCGYGIYKFYESDLNNEVTAVASGPVPSHKRAFMRRYKCLKFR